MRSAGSVEVIYRRESEYILPSKTDEETAHSMSCILEPFLASQTPISYEDYPTDPFTNLAQNPSMLDLV